MRRVNLYVDQPSQIELTTHEHVRIERLQRTEAHGYIAQQYGALLAPGVTQLPLETGTYHFRTLDDAQLRVVAGGVQVTTSERPGKDSWPTIAEDPAVLEAVEPRGDGPCGHMPVLQVICNTNPALFAEAGAHRVHPLDDTSLQTITGGIQEDSVSFASEEDFSASLDKNIDEPFIRRIRF